MPFDMTMMLALAILIKMSNSNIISLHRRPSAMEANKMREIRERLGMTQQEFGLRLANVSQAAISQMENGQTRITKAMAEAAHTMLERHLQQQSKLAS